MFQESVDKIIAQYQKAHESDGKVSFFEIVGILQGAVLEFVTLAESLKVSGPEKKQAVLQSLETFIDTVITPIDLPYIPNLVEPVVDGAVKKTLLSLADILIDRVVSSLKRIGTGL